MNIPKGTYPRYTDPENGPEIRVENAADHERKHPEDYAKLMNDLEHPPEKVTAETAVRKALDEQAASFQEHLGQVERDHDQETAQLKVQHQRELEAAKQAPSVDVTGKAVAAETKRCADIVTLNAPVKVGKTIVDAFYGIPAKADDAATS